MTPDEALRKLLMGYERRIKALEDAVESLRRERADAVVDRSLDETKPRWRKAKP